MRALAAALTILVAEPAEAVDSRVEAVGDRRVLVHEVLVAAPVADVWALIATADGWQSWAVPVAWMDFRLGGIIETSYDPEAKQNDANNIRSRILAYIPGRMLSIQAEKGPADFPFNDQLAKHFSVFELTAEGARTRVRLTGVGYDGSEESQKMMKFFEAGNRWSLEQLAERVGKGPVDWQSSLKPQEKEEINTRR